MINLATLWSQSCNVTTLLLMEIRPSLATRQDKCEFIIQRQRKKTVLWSIFCGNFCSLGARRYLRWQGGVFYHRRPLGPGGVVASATLQRMSNSAKGKGEKLKKQLGNETSNSSPKYRSKKTVNDLILFTLSKNFSPSSGARGRWSKIRN